MPVVLRRLGVALAALVLSSGLALAQSKVTLAVGGGSCLCYLPTMLAKRLANTRRPASMSRSSTSRVARNRSRR